MSTSDGTGAQNGDRASARTGSRGPAVDRVARLGAVAAILAVIVVVLVLVFGTGSAYTVHADFQNASGLVVGDNVLLGPAAVGSIKSIDLTREGQADVTMTLHHVGTLRSGTIARIHEDSLSGIADRYVSIEPSAQGHPIRSGGTIGAQDTYSEVNIDEVFDAFNASTRQGLQNLVRGEATSLRGKGALAGRTLTYLAPGLESTSDVTHQLAGDEPAFDRLIVQGAQAMARLASRSRQLSDLVASTDTATGAIDRQSVALQRALSALPGTLNRSTRSFQGLDTTLSSLDPVVSAAKPAARRLPQFVAQLRRLSTDALPTVAELDDLILNPRHTGDLTSLALSAPGLLVQADRAFPELERNFTESRAQLDYLREYTPDVTAALTDVGQASSYYDANGHYVRTAPMLYPFTTNSMGQLVMQNPDDRYDGLQHTTSRCPGAAVQASPDGSTPGSAPDCVSSQVPSGP